MLFAEFRIIPFFPVVTLPAVVTTLNVHHPATLFSKQKTLSGHVFFPIPMREIVLFFFVSFPVTLCFDRSSPPHIVISLRKRILKRTLSNFNPAPLEGDSFPSLKGSSRDWIFILYSRISLH